MAAVSEKGQFITEDLCVRRSCAINANDHHYLPMQWISWLKQDKNKTRTNIPGFSIERSGRASDVNDEYMCEFQWTCVLDGIRMHPMQ